MILSSIAEVITLGAVIPFLGLLANPETFYRQDQIRTLIDFFNIDTSLDISLYVTAGFILTAALAAVIRLINLWLGINFSASVGSDLSTASYFRILQQSIDYHCKSNTSSLVTLVTSQVNRTVSAISAFLQMMTSIFVSLGLIAGLIYINWQIAFSTILVFGGVYLAIAFFTRRILVLNGYNYSVYNKLMMKSLQEGFGSIRDVILSNNFNYYLNSFSSADAPMRKVSAHNQFVSLTPRYVVETIGIVFISFLGLALNSQQSNSESVIPTLGAFALGAQRLLPSLQQIFGGWSNLKGAKASMYDVINILNLPPSPSYALETHSSFKKFTYLCLENLSYEYDASSDSVLKNINLTIKQGDCLGVIGETGSGKSTLIDILMALRLPKSGSIIVNDIDICKQESAHLISSWQSLIAHVPQNIFLSDNSIAENIAFGIPFDLIDMSRVRLAAQQAQISSFIESSPDAYQTLVGERGTSLSGGQCQRIGIARALYKNAQVLIFDEATSALDSTTEYSVMQAIENLPESLTLIMIAHRTSTLKKCNRIIKLSNASLTEIPVTNI